MSTLSNHTKAFVQCCHGKHTVASSRTLLFLHVYPDNYKTYWISLFFISEWNFCWSNYVSPRNDVRWVRSNSPRHAQLPPVGYVRQLPSIWSGRLRQCHLRIWKKSLGLRRTLLSLQVPRQVPARNRHDRGSILEWCHRAVNHPSDLEDVSLLPVEMEATCLAMTWIFPSARLLGKNSLLTCKV